MGSKVVNVMYRYCLQFSQNHQLKTILLETAGTVLAEASPSDRKWGIGLAEDDPHAKRRKMWRGRNLLGEVLMEVRDEMTSIDDDTDTLVLYFIIIIYYAKWQHIIIIYNNVRRYMN